MTQVAHPAAHARTREGLSPPLEWLAAPSPAWRYGIRWGFAMSVAVWLAHAAPFGYALPQPSFLLFTVAMIALPSSGASIQKAVFRIGGTLLGGLSAIVIWGVGVQFPVLEMAGVFLAVTVGVYWMVGPRAQYVGQVMAFTTPLLLGAAYPFSDSSIETVAFERVTLVILGVVIVLVADSLFWPVRSGPALRAALATSAGNLRKNLAACLDALAAGRPPHAGPATTSTLATELPLVDQFRMELGVSRVRADAGLQVALLLEGLELRTRQLHTILASLPPRAQPAALAEAVGQLRNAVDAGLVEAIGALGSTADPVSALASRARDSRAQDALNALEQAGIDALDEAALRSRGGVAGTSDLSRRVRQAPILRDLVRGLARLEESVNVLNGVEPVPKPSRAPRAPFWRQLRIDVSQLQLGMRAGFAVCISLWFVLAAGWSANSLALIVAFTLATTPAFRTVKSAAVSIGVLTVATAALADLAIVYLFPHVQRMPLALGFAFSVMAMAGYLAVTRPRPFAALGGLGGILILLPIFGEPSAPTDVFGPYNTACYLLVGAGSAVVSAFLFWPATSTQLFWKRGAAQLETCRELFDVSAIREDGVRDRTLEHVQAFATGLAKLAALHGQAQQDPDNSAGEDRRRADLLTRIQAHFEAALHFRSVPTPERELGEAPDWADGDGLRAALTRLDRALAGGMESTAAALRGYESTPSVIGETQRDVEERIAAIRAHPALARDFGARSIIALGAYVDAQLQLASAQLDVEEWVAGWREPAEAA